MTAIAWISELVGCGRRQSCEQATRETGGAPERVFTVPAAARDAVRTHVGLHNAVRPLGRSHSNPATHRTPCIMQSPSMCACLRASVVTGST